MRVFLTLISLFVFASLFAQKADTVSLKKNIEALNQALIDRDSVTLKGLLDERLTYGHSNGWVETKRNVIEDLFNGKLLYSRIEQTAPQIIPDKGLASVRAVADVDVSLDGKGITLRLSILQVWIVKNGKWVLLSRQSGKVN